MPEERLEYRITGVRKGVPWGTDDSAWTHHRPRQQEVADLERDSQDVKVQRRRVTISDVETIDVKTLPR